MGRIIRCAATLVLLVGLGSVGAAEPVKRALGGGVHVYSVIQIGSEFNIAKWCCLAQAVSSQNDPLVAQRPFFPKILPLFLNP